MPNAKDNAKATGDTHLPEIESEDLERQESHPQGTGTPGTQDRERHPDGTGSPPRDGNKAGVVRRDEDGLEEG